MYANQYNTGVCSATTGTNHTAFKTVGELTAQNSELMAKITELQQTLKELRENKNSQNSSKPPSSDGYGLS